MFYGKNSNLLVDQAVWDEGYQITNCTSANRYGAILGSVKIISIIIMVMFVNARDTGEYVSRNHCTLRDDHSSLHKHCLKFGP